MPIQHSIEEEVNQEQGIVVPLELEGLRILKQEVQSDGTVRVEVIGTNERVNCPHCQKVCVKRHDVRPRSKRDVPLRGHRVELVLYKRRFWCLRCHKAFTEPDRACGRGKRTTLRLVSRDGSESPVWQRSCSINLPSLSFIVRRAQDSFLLPARQRG
jgi:transposase